MIETPRRLNRRPVARLVVGILAALAWTGSAGAEANDVFKIGVIGFLSGPAAESFGVPSVNTAKMLAEKLNASSVPAPYSTMGIGGRRIELVVVDEGLGGTKVVESFRNLVERDHVDAVIGPIGSGTCLAVAPVAEDLKQFTILSDCGTPQVFEARSYQYVFRAGAHGTMDNVSLVLYLRDKGIKFNTFGTINQKYAYGQDAWADFKASLDNLVPGKKVNSELWPAFGAGQYGAEISALQKDGSDLIYSSLWGGDLQAFVLQAAPRGLFKDSKLALMAAAHVLPALGNKMPDGVIMGERGATGLLARPSALNDWFWNSYSDAFKQIPASSSAYRMAQSMLGLKAAAEQAMKRTGGKKPSSEELAAAMTGLEWDAPAGRIRMALGKGHQAIQDAAVGTTKWDPERKMVTLVDVQYYDAECVNPPEGVKSIDWIQSGFKGAKCR
jgi:branched-chain amino acid transport system substrate-binding protein